MVIGGMPQRNMLFLQLRPTLAVNVDAANCRHSRRIVPEDIAHVIEQPCGHKDDRGRAMLAAVDTVYENFCASMTDIKSCRFFAVGSEPRSSDNKSTLGRVAK